MIDLREQIYEDAEAKIGEIEKEQGEYFDLDAQKQTVAEKMSAKESEIYSEVCGEKGEGEKPKFSNDGSRKAETEVRLQNDQNFQQLKTELATKTREVAVKRFRIDAMNAKVNLAKAFLHGS